VDYLLTAANTWQSFSVNLAALRSAQPIGADLAVCFPAQFLAVERPRYTDTLAIDNIKL